MPRANIYIREDDWDKWQAIEKKSEFIRNALNTKWDVKDRSVEVETDTGKEVVDYAEVSLKEPLPPSTSKPRSPKEEHKTYFKKGKK